MEYYSASKKKRNFLTHAATDEPEDILLSKIHQSQRTIVMIPLYEFEGAVKTPQRQKVGWTVSV